MARATSREVDAASRAEKASTQGALARIRLCMTGFSVRSIFRRPDAPRRPPKPAPMQRVLIYGMNHAPEIVGVGRYTADIVNELARRGYMVSVITAPPHYPHWDTRFWREQGFRNRYAREARDGVTIWRCPLVLRRPMRGAWRLLAPLSFAIGSAPLVIWRILRDRPGLVVCVEPTLLAAPAAVAAARLVRASCVLHVHDLEPEAAVGAGNGWAGRYAGVLAERVARLRRHFDGVVTLSPAMGRELARHGLASSRIHLWPNWIDVRRIARGHDPARADAWRREADIGDGQRIVLCAGSINRKHAPLLLANAARLLRHRDDLVVVIAGDGPLRADLAAETADLANVRLLPLQPEEALPALLQFADVHVMPQDPAWDGLALPSRLAGMLASGKPVVITGNADTELGKFLGTTARMCRPHDAAALAAAIAQALAPSCPVQARRGRNARWRKALLLDRRRCLNGVVDVLEAVAARQKPGRREWASGATARVVRHMMMVKSDRTDAP